MMFAVIHVPNARADLDKLFLFLGGGGGEGGIFKTVITQKHINLVYFCNFFYANLELLVVGTTRFMGKISPFSSLSTRP